MPIDRYMKNPRRLNLWQRIGRRRGWGYPDMFTFYGSVLPNILPVVFSTALWSGAVCFVYIELGKDISLPMDLVSSVAVVVGLLLAFRTNNAYDRFWEGRKLFGNMCTHIRNCARTIWIGVRETSDSESDHDEKEQAIKLLLAYVVAVKHHLRLEFGIKWEDLEDLLPPGFQLTRFDGTADQQQEATGTAAPDQPPTIQDGQDGQISAIPDPVPIIAETIRPLTSGTYSLLRSVAYANDATIYFDDQVWAEDVDASMSLPLEIVMHLGLYIDQKSREKKLDEVRFSFCWSDLNALIDSLGNLERIGNTPIPHAYNVHLKQAVTVYVWALPFVLVTKLAWITVPAVTLIGFVLFGVEGIGAEIENPFGYDKNDLPLDEYCKDLEAEVKYLQRHIPEKKSATSNN